MFTSSVLTFTGRQGCQRFLRWLINHILHQVPSQSIPRRVSRIEGPSHRLSRERRRFARVDANEMADETDVVIHEGRILRREQTNFTSSPEMQPHPYTSIVRLKVLPPLVPLSLWTMPDSEVGTGPVES